VDQSGDEDVTLLSSSLIYYAKFPLFNMRVLDVLGIADSFPLSVCL
jgi:hypothetical protein